MNTDDYEGHTEGPWRFGYTGDTYAVITGKDDWILRVDVENEGVSLSEADAKLIAAAPDLLQALIDERARIIELEEELVDLRERRRWADTHHIKCEDIHGAECVPSEEEVERFDKAGDWEEEE